MMLDAKARCYWKNSAEISHGQVFRSTFEQELSSDCILIELRGAIKTSSLGIGKPWAREVLVPSAVIRIRESCMCEFSRDLYLGIIVDTAAKLLGNWQLSSE
jgi:hypothetical protein